MTVDYRNTVFLPSTDFPMKASLPKREPELIQRWQDMKLYQRLRQAAKGRTKFILHDGPPYANGHLHIGHAVNKILKDVVTRSQQMLGKDSNYVPGWDCHGLPIEWKIEEQYRAAGKNKDETPIVEFRAECRKFAEHWIGIQKAEFQRLGVEGDWENPYTTMTYAAEAQILRELHKFLMNGSLYRGSKPVMWSIVEKTALAEAEVEYHDHTSPTIWVRFPVRDTSPNPVARGASIVIWTTTPWTIPGNRAVALNADADYVRVKVLQAAEGSLATIGEEFFVAAALLDQVLADAKISEVSRRENTYTGAELLGTICKHPWHGKGYDFEVPLLAGSFVTLDQGTGFVHIAPGHGTDDFELGQKHGLETPFTVAEDGSYYPDVPLFTGKRVLTDEGKEGDANGTSIRELIASGALLAKGRIKHSYPHSWRSRAPLIYRNTPQWFISMTSNGLRQKALSAIDKVRWVPAAGRNRLYAMIENRPDWVISRQRSWGVPIAVFVDKKTRMPLRDPDVNQRIADAVEKEGADAWFASPAGRFLGSGYNPDDYEKVDDILDVWFDSGSTHAYVLERRPDLQWPASLYLEGSDQHRGWFHSSLLESCGTRGRAPYEAVLTHGFAMDSDGRKMSKSLGNVIAPQQVIDQYGADILRLWVLSSDYGDDIRVGSEILKSQAESYRKIRNTLRYLLGNLTHFKETERVAVEQMPDLERWVLHRLHEIDTEVRRACGDFAFNAMFVTIYNFCISDLSAFYFDIRKDALYCDPPGAMRRRSARTVLDHVFSCLTAWLAPILCFTAEEAWLARNPGSDQSVHLRLFPTIPEQWHNGALAEKWGKIRDLRRVVTGALEIERREKRIGAGLEARAVIYAGANYREAVEGVDLAEICITSGIELQNASPPADAFRIAELPDIAVIPMPADGSKCERCWQVLPEVGQAKYAKDLCHRCDDAVHQLSVSG